VNKDNLAEVSCKQHAVHRGNTLSLTLLNARSVASKSTLLSEYITENSVQILAITETWLKEGDDSVVNDLCPQGYRFEGIPRPTSKGTRGGGIGFVIHADLDTTPIPQSNFRTFESYAIRLKGKQPVTTALVYRPPPSHKNGFTAADFFKELEDFLSQLCTSVPGQLCIIGDFNVHCDRQDCPHNKHLQDILTSLDLKQHVTDATHSAGHTLDLVITRNDPSHSLVESLSVRDIGVSDHFAVTIQLLTSLTPTAKRTRKARSLKNISPEVIATDLVSALQCTSEEAHAEHLTSQYYCKVEEVLDKHAPLRTVTIKGDSYKPWYDSKTHEARMKRRQLEHKFLKTGLEVHKQMLKEQSQLVVTLINSNKSAYYQDKLSSADCKETFKVINSLMCHDAGNPLPPATSDQALAEDFVNFFQDKVEKIRHGLDAKCPTDAVTFPPPDTKAPSISEFRPQTLGDISKIIQKCPNKSCSLDCISTSLLKQDLILQAVLPTLTTLINTSLSSGVFPDSLKRAQVTPLLKKTGLDVSSFANYRPVSNIPFLSKVMEKVVAYQLNDHMKRNGLHDHMQSAYKQGSSTETALIRIKSDIETVLNDGDGVLLVLLDLSAAFDTVDHAILIERLHEEVGLQDTALQWLRSYLTDRKQAVYINNSVSSEVSLATGVPQGSVLGPLLFLIYILPLQRVITRFKVARHGFADDTQLYNRLTLRNQSSWESQVQTMQDCIADVRTWMMVNRLKLNDSKTEVMVVTSKNNKELMKHIKIKIGEDIITPKTVVRNLGATLDCNLSMEPQVNSVTRRMYFNIRRISKIKHHLTQESCAKAINATVISHLDYHNGLLLGLPEKSIHKLQVAQNNAARLLTGATRREHMKPVLQHLHWLPVRQRITFKVLTIIQKTLHSAVAPVYLQDLCTVYHPRRTLRSSSDQWKLESSCTTNQYGTRSLKALGVKLWNQLPADIRLPISQTVFRKHLKTLLFKQEYEHSRL